MPPEVTLVPTIQRSPRPRSWLALSALSSPSVIDRTPHAPGQLARGSHGPPAATSPILDEGRTGRGGRLLGDLDDQLQRRQPALSVVDQLRDLGEPANHAGQVNRYDGVCLHHAPKSAPFRTRS